jgi:serine/threonine protein phosphatase PrpC
VEGKFSMVYQRTEDENDFEYAFFGIFDGHRGREAAKFTKKKIL